MCPKLVLEHESNSHGNTIDDINLTRALFFFAFYMMFFFRPNIHTSYDDRSSDTFVLLLFTRYLDTSCFFIILIQYYIYTTLMYAHVTNLLEFIMS